MNTLNCPFCGSLGVAEKNEGAENGYVYSFYRPKCSNPGCIWENEYYSERGAIKAWNSRIPVTAEAAP